MNRALLLAVWLLASIPALADNTAMPPLVGPEWVAARLDEPRLRIVDIRNPFGYADRHTYELGHIPGAVYSNYVTDDWHDHSVPVPATLPSVTQLETLIGRLGIDRDSRVVIVHSGLNSTDFSAAARVYWIFRLLGHERVAILDGGYRAWESTGLPVEQGWNTPQAARFHADLDDELLATTDEVTDALHNAAQLVDARARDLYEGRTRAAVTARAGTLPTARNLEHRRMLDPATGRFVRPEVLSIMLREAGIAPDRRTIAFCNIGHWSAATWFALHVIAGFPEVALYDGSMAEWTASPERPVVIPVAALPPGPP